MKQVSESHLWECFVIWIGSFLDEIEGADATKRFTIVTYHAT